MTLSDGLDPKDFVSNIDLAGVPEHPARFLESAEPALVARSNRPQSVVVGSGVLAFNKSVPAERRAMIANATLLAQLVATKRVSDPSMSTDWYRAYFDVLRNMGWRVMVQDTVILGSGAQELQVHQAILQLASTLLGGTTDAFRLVKS